jgi:hypothetical protein
MKGPGDLEVSEGIGPKIAQLLRQHGIGTFVRSRPRPSRRSRPSSRRAAPTSASQTRLVAGAGGLLRPQTTGPASSVSKTGSPPAGSEVAGHAAHQRPHARVVGGLRPGEADRRSRAGAHPPRLVALRPRAGQRRRLPRPAEGCGRRRPGHAAARRCARGRPHRGPTPDPACARALDPQVLSPRTARS